MKSDGFRPGHVKATECVTALAFFGCCRTKYQIVQFANKSIGEPRVSCYTCHRGHKEPEMPANTRSFLSTNTAPAETALAEAFVSSEINVNRSEIPFLQWSTRFP